MNIQQNPHVASPGPTTRHPPAFRPPFPLTQPQAVQGSDQLFFYLL